MKHIFVLILIAFTTIMTSCKKEEVLELEITVVTLPSEKWESVEFEIPYIRFLSLNPVDSVTGVSSLQRWMGAELSFNLDKRQEELIADTEHWEQHLIRFDPNIFQFSLTKAGSETNCNAEFLENHNQFLTESILLEDGKRYSIEMIFDFDKMIFEENGRFYCSEFELEISEI